MFFGKRFSGYHEGSVSGLEILVMTLIKGQPNLTGYDIIQEINRKFKPMWKASPGTIYPLLKRLLRKELVNVEEIVDENNREKRIYTISEKGIEELKKVLKGNLEPSIHTLGKFIRTISKGINFDGDIEKIFSCFPFSDPGYEREIDVKDISRENIERIIRRVKGLKRHRRRLKKRMEDINNQINHYEEILENLKNKREKEAKPIPIVEDDDEFEDF
ncbi:MAG: PadR family transcriptional regulator [Promethearchaeati archaeon]